MRDPRAGAMMAAMSNGAQWAREETRVILSRSAGARGQRRRANLDSAGGAALRKDERGLSAVTNQPRADPHSDPRSGGRRCRYSTANLAARDVAGIAQRRREEACKGDDCCAGVVSGVVDAGRRIGGGTKGAQNPARRGDRGVVCQPVRANRSARRRRSRHQVGSPYGYARRLLEATTRRAVAEEEMMARDSVTSWDEKLCASSKQRRYGRGISRGTIVGQLSQVKWKINRQAERFAR